MRMYVVAMVAAVGVLAGSASAGVVMGGTETSPLGTADWGVGGPDEWQALYEVNGANYSEVHYGSTGTLINPNTAMPWVGNTSGQPDPGSKTADGSGTMVVQHLAAWDGGANDPVTHVDCGKQIQTITFPSVLGVEYTLTAWVNTTRILNPADGDWTKDYPAGDRFGGHPRSVGGMLSQFPAIEIGLKDGLVVAGDFAAGVNTTPVPGLLDTLTEPDAWVQGQVTMTGTGNTMSIILKHIAPDISSGSLSDLDVRWDDITLTPEPTSLGLLGLGFLFVVRRRR